MIKKFNHRPALWVLIILILISTLTAAAAGNTIPTTRLDENTAAMNANAIKPASCASLNLTSIVICPSTGGACNGNNASELILGSPSNDDIQSGKGDDCILGGGGDDAIRGEQGLDVCIGGPNNDTFHPSCETQNQ